MKVLLSEVQDLCNNHQSQRDWFGVLSVVLCCFLCIIYIQSLPLDGNAAVSRDAAFLAEVVPLPS